MRSHSHPRVAQRAGVVSKAAGGGFSAGLVPFHLWDTANLFGAISDDDLEPPTPTQIQDCRCVSDRRRMSDYMWMPSWGRRRDHSDSIRAGPKWLAVCCWCNRTGTPSFPDSRPQQHSPTPPGWCAGMCAGRGSRASGMRTAPHRVRRQRRRLSSYKSSLSKTTVETRYLTTY